MSEKNKAVMVRIDSHRFYPQDVLRVDPVVMTLNAPSCRIKLTNGADIHVQGSVHDVFFAITESLDGEKIRAREKHLSEALVMASACDAALTSRGEGSIGVISDENTLFISPAPKHCGQQTNAGHFDTDILKAKIDNLERELEEEKARKCELAVKVLVDTPCKED